MIFSSLIKLQVRLLFLLLFLLGMGSCQTTEREKAAIKSSFEKYKQAILAEDYSKVVDCLDHRTLSYYEDLRRQALEADSPTVAALPVLDEIMVLYVRALATREALDKLDSSTFLQFIFKNGLLEKKNFLGVELGAVKLEKQFAVAEILTATIQRDLASDRIQNREGIPTLEFYKEAGTWKLSLVALMQDLNRYMSAAFAEKGFTKNEFVKKAVKEQTGAEPKFHF